MSEKKSKWIELGSILMSKDKGDGSTPKPYIQIKEDVVLKKGDYIQMETPQDGVARLVQYGHLTEEQAAERLLKIPAFVKYNLKLAPKD